MPHLGLCPSPPSSLSHYHDSHSYSRSIIALLPLFHPSINPIQLVLLNCLSFHPISIRVPSDLHPNAMAHRSDGDSPPSSSATAQHPHPRPQSQSKSQLNNNTTPNSSTSSASSPRHGPSVMDVDCNSSPEDRSQRATSVLSMDDLEAAQALEGLRSGVCLSFYVVTV